MDNDLGLFVPSRGRPQNMARLWRAMQETCRAGTTLLAGLDEDDPAKDAYPPGPGYDIRPGLRYVTAWVNALAASHAGRFTAIGTIGDDNVPETPGWDEQVLAALEDRPFAFADDAYPLRPAGTLACHIFMRTGIYRALGYFGPPSLRHMYVDVAWTAWARACGVAFLDQVVIRHRHYTTGAAQLDDTYARSSSLMLSDLGAWHAYAYGGALNADIAKLGGTPYTPARLDEFNAGLGIPAGPR